MLKVLSYILCDLDPQVKVIGQKAGICDGVPSTSALVFIMLMNDKMPTTVGILTFISMIFMFILVAKKIYNNIWACFNIGIQSFQILYLSC